MPLKDKLPKKRLWTLEPKLLLCPNVPRPMHGVAPRYVLGEVWWNKTREEAYRSTSFRCKACGVWRREAKDKKWLEGHEVYEINYKKGRMTYLRTVPLCHYCHNYIHDGRMKTLMDKGDFPRAKYIAVIQHGDRVLLTAGLTRPSYREREHQVIELALNGELAVWENWRMILDGKEYPPKFHTPEQWKRAMQ